MKAKLIFLLIVTILANLLSGCWNRKEINELSIVTAVGIDKSSEGYLVSVQIINPSEIASEKKASNRTPVNTYHASGRTIFEAVRRLTLETPRRAYFAHMRLLVFGEEMAKEGIARSLDLFSRDHEIRSDYSIVIAKNQRAEKLLEILTPVELIPANKILSSLKTSQKVWAPTHMVELDELLNSLSSEGQDATLTGVIIKGNPDIGMSTNNLENVELPASLLIQYIGAFKGDKLVGWLSEKESMGYGYITDEVSGSVVTIPYGKDGKLGVEIVRSKTKVKGKVENGKPKIDIEVLAEGNIAEVESEVDLSKSKNIYKIQAIVEEQVKTQIEAAIQKAQKDLKSDIFGFGEVIHRADPKAWKEFKKDWNQEFSHVKPNIRVTVKIRRSGTTIKPVQAK